MKTLTLNTGAKIPIVGFGTWQIKDSDVGQCISTALKSGYRHIDTATLYKNESGIGYTLKKTNIARSELFITTKLWPLDFLNPQKAFNLSLNKLQLDYIDLYLLHWPFPFWGRAWKNLEIFYHQGLAKSIGVSNFSIRQLQELKTNSDITPAVNQVEISPFTYNPKFLDYCHSQKIVVQAYSPLTQGKRLNHPVIQKISQKYHKSVAQILLRWCIQHNLVVLPRSQNPDHIKENINIFDFQISSSDMNQLNSLNENYRSLFDYAPRK